MSGLWHADVQATWRATARNWQNCKAGFPMLKLESRPQASRLWTYGSPVLALCVTVLIGVALFTLLGKDPVRGCRSFFWEPVRSQYALGELMVKATPLLLIALGLAVCFRSNVWNIGAEGQFVMGAIFAGGVALLASKDTGAWIVPTLLLAGVLGGMVWAGLTALLRDRFNANEILVSLMLVYVATLLLELSGVRSLEGPHGLQLPADAHVRESDADPAFDGGLARAHRPAHCWPVRQRCGCFCSAHAPGLRSRWVGWRLMRPAMPGFRRAARSGRRCWFRAVPPGWRGAGGGRADRPAHALCPRRLRFCRHHRGLCGAPASGGHGVFGHSHEHVLHRRRTGAVAPGLAQIAHRRVPGLLLFSLLACDT